MMDVVNIYQREENRREEENVGRNLRNHLKHYHFTDGETEVSRQEVISLRLTDGACHAGSYVGVSGPVPRTRT